MGPRTHPPTKPNSRTTCTIRYHKTRFRSAAGARGRKTRRRRFRVSGHRRRRPRHGDPPASTGGGPRERQQQRGPAAVAARRRGGGVCGVPRALQCPPPQAPLPLLRSHLLRALLPHATARARGFHGTSPPAAGWCVGALGPRPADAAARVPALRRGADRVPGGAPPDGQPREPGIDLTECVYNCMRICRAGRSKVGSIGRF